MWSVLPCEYFGSCSRLCLASSEYVVDRNDDASQLPPCFSFSASWPGREQRYSVSPVKRLSLRSDRISCSAKVCHLPKSLKPCFWPSIRTYESAYQEYAEITMTSISTRSA